MFERWLVPAFATVLSFTFFLAGLASVAWLLLSTAIPCEPVSWFYIFTQVCIVVAFFTNAVFMGRLKLAPKTGKFVIALALPLLSVGLHAVAAQWNAAEQRSCIEQRGIR